MTIIDDAVKKLIREQLDLIDNDIPMDAVLTDELGADSLDIVEIALGLEDEFDILIPDDQIQTVRTCKHLVELVDAHLNT